MSPELAARAAAQGGVFTRADAESCGYTLDQVRQRLDTSRWRALRRGIYTTCELWPTDDEVPPVSVDAAACLLVAADAVVSDATAATLHGIALLGRQPRWIRLTRPRAQGGDCYAKRLTVWPAALPAAHVTRAGDLRVTSPARTVIDLARRRGFRDGVVAADSALHQGLTDAAELSSVVRDCTRWPGIVTARAAVAFADAAAESALESLSRIMFVEQDLPMPSLQERVGAYRVDFLWDGRVVGEADGAKKYDGSNPAALLDEKRRQEALEDLGLVVVRWGWDDVVRRPAVTAARIRRALARADQRTA